MPLGNKIQNRGASATICSGGGKPVVWPIFSGSTAEPLSKIRPFNNMTLPNSGASAVTSVCVRFENSRSFSNVITEVSNKSSPNKIEDKTECHWCNNRFCLAVEKTDIFWHYKC